MNLLCAECVDVAIKNGEEVLDGIEDIEAISLFPALSVAQTNLGNVANFVPLPLCYRHRKLMKSKTGLVTA